MLRWLPSKFKVTAWGNVHKFAKLSIIQPGIAQFRSNSIHNLITWHLMYHELARSTGQWSRLQRDITYHHQNAIIQVRISCRKLNFVKIIPGRSATRNAMFKVIRSNNEIAITPPLIVRLCLNLVQSSITLQAIRCKCSRSEVKVTGSKVKFTA